MNCELIMLLPSKEHVEELKQKGIDLEAELSRIMYENLNLVKQGLAPKTIGVSITKEQMEELSKYGIDATQYTATTVKKEMHERIYKK